MKEKLSLDWAKKNKLKILFILTAIGIFVFFYALNVLYPIYLDDWFYSFSSFSERKWINSFSSILESQYIHYFDWGGRNVVHAVAQLLLWFGQTWGDILNTIAYICLILFIYNIANKDGKTNVPLFLLINILIWFVLPAFSQNILWITGSANYLWGGLIILAFIFPYVKYYYNQKENNSIWRNILFAITGILAGWTNENMGAALIFFLIAFIVLLKYRKIPIQPWIIYGLIGAAIGFIIMISAPGNFLRSKHEFMAVHKLEEVPLSFYFYRFVTIVKLSCTYLLKPALIYIILGLAFWFSYKGEKKKKTDILLLSLLFLATAAIATMAMSGSPVFPERAWCGILFMLITAIAVLYAHIDLSNKILRIINYAALVLLIALYIYSGKESYAELKRFNQVIQHRQQLIDKEKAKGIQDIVITDNLFEKKDSRFVVLDLNDWQILERDGFAERMGKYNGVNTIKIYESQE